MLRRRGNRMCMEVLEAEIVGIDRIMVKKFVENILKTVRSTEKE